MARFFGLFGAFTGFVLAYFVLGPSNAYEVNRTVIIGGQFDYTVASGDFLKKIGARHGVDPRVIARDNGLAASAKLQAGQVLRVDNRHLVPLGRSNGIIVNIPQRMLFHLVNGDVVGAFPIAPGKPDWQTPLGEFTILSKEKDKTWYVPPSIQEEMRLEGKPVLTEVPPGPENPLGRYWIGLSLPAIGIHGTLAPTSLYDFRSHGCIRLHPEDVESLFSQINRGTPGDIIYQPLLIGAHNGRVFIEAHRDVYGRGSVGLKYAQRMAMALGLYDRIDWTKAAVVVKAREGVARDVTVEQQITAENLY